MPCSLSSFPGTPLCVLRTIASFCKPGVAAQFPGKRAVTPAQASGHFPAAQAHGHKDFDPDAFFQSQMAMGHGDARRVNLRDRCSLPFRTTEFLRPNGAVYRETTPKSDGSGSIIAQNRRVMFLSNSFSNCLSVLEKVYCMLPSCARSIHPNTTVLL